MHSLCAVLLLAGAEAVSREEFERLQQLVVAQAEQLAGQGQQLAGLGQQLAGHGQQLAMLTEERVSLQGRVATLVAENANLRAVTVGTSAETSVGRLLSEVAQVSCCRWTASGECGSSVTKECTRMPLWSSTPRTNRSICSASA